MQSSSSGSGIFSSFSSISSSLAITFFQTHGRWILGHPARTAGEAGDSGRSIHPSGLSSFHLDFRAVLIPVTVQFLQLCNHLVPAADQPLEVADQQVRCFQLFQDCDCVFHKLGIENIIAVPEFAVQSVTYECVGFLHFQPQAALAMAGGQWENMQIANVNILCLRRCPSGHGVWFQGIQKLP